MTLTEKQLGVLVAAIHERRGRLEEELDGDVLAGGQLSDADAGDSARDLQELHALDHAVSRIAEGTYGMCADCGTLIPYERLAAAPHAARCIECQARFEQAHPKAAPKL